MQWGRLVAIIIWAVAGFAWADRVDNSVGVDARSFELFANLVRRLGEAKMLSVDCTARLEYPNDSADIGPLVFKQRLLFRRADRLSVRNLAGDRIAPEFYYSGSQAKLVIAELGVISRRVPDLQGFLTSTEFGFDRGRGVNPFIERNRAVSFVLDLLMPRDKDPFDQSFIDCESLGRRSQDESVVYGIRIVRAIGRRSRSADIWLTDGPQPRIETLEIGNADDSEDGPEGDGDERTSRFRLHCSYENWNYDPTITDELFTTSDSRLREFGDLRRATVFAYRSMTEDQRLRERLIGNSVSSDLTLDLLAGSPFRLSDVRGKIVVLDFWASWCGSSTRAVPRWSEVLADPKYADIIYLAVNQGESSSDVRKFVEQQSWPCQVAVDEQREIGRAFEVRSLPQTAILDRNGTIVDVLFGWGQNLEAVKSRLDRAMIRHDATVHETLDNIRARERTIKELVGRCAPAVVGLMVGRGGGSGVIVSADGMVLTAAHVTASAGIDVRVFLADGREVMGKSLGADHSRDAAIIKLEGAGPWPHVELGSAPHELGQWVFAMGHPGGYATDRAAPLRVGRIVKLPGGVGRARGFFATDCTVTHGDSGGPVFDLEGRVIGIHSFISTRLEENMHVPVEAYQSGWNRLVNSEVWGRSGRDGSVRAALGAFLRHVEGKGIVVTRVVPGSPAQRAGLLQGDLLLGFAGLEKVESLEDLEREMRKYRPGDRVKFMLRRGEEPIRGELTFAARLD